MTHKIEKQTDLEKLFDFMSELNKVHGEPATKADLIHTIHLTIGAILEQVDTVRRAVEAAEATSGK